ncbi:hypothetical protein EVAR_60710_1 [Eumeta japonica]|uniref:Uncharacterized protein n=1 Tax=Eumeta variegata TaxID=151549 RepID=A0A4C1ZD80_EUMVA|nr:hypothetical protein EVAR_60710_1 [Eumeta japonica]
MCVLASYKLEPRALSELIAGKGVESKANVELKARTISEPELKAISLRGVRKFRHTLFTGHSPLRSSRVFNFRMVIVASLGGFLDLRKAPLDLLRHYLEEKRKQRHIRHGFARQNTKQAATPLFLF